MFEKDDYMGFELCGSDSAFHAARERLGVALLASIEKRFSDMKQGITKASRIIKMENWPSAGSSEINGVKIRNLITFSFAFQFIFYF